MYYAGPGNLFWPVLYEVGLTPVRLAPADFRQVLDYGIGLTNLVKSKAGMDSVLRSPDFENATVLRKMQQFQPRFLCFNGKRGAQEFLRRPVAYGLQPETVGVTRLFVVPSTSGAAKRYWDIQWWQEIAALAKV